jgi:hypothetical protein
MSQTDSERILTRRDFNKISAVVGAGLLYSLIKHSSIISDLIEEVVQSNLDHKLLSQKKEPYTNLRIKTDDKRLNNKCVVPASQHKELLLAGTNPYFRATHGIFDWLGNYGQSFLTVDYNNNLSLKTISHVWNSIVATGCFAIRIPGTNNTVFDIDTLKPLDPKDRESIVDIPITDDYMRYVKQEVEVRKIIPLAPSKKSTYINGEWINACVPHNKIPDYFSPVKVLYLAGKKHLIIISSEKIIEPGFSGSPIIETNKQKGVTNRVLGSLSTGGILSTKMREKLLGTKGAYFALARTFN